MNTRNQGHYEDKKFIKGRIELIPISCLKYGEQVTGRDGPVLPLISLGKYFVKDLEGFRHKSHMLALGHIPQKSPG